MLEPEPSTTIMKDRCCMVPKHSGHNVLPNSVRFDFHFMRRYAHNVVLNMS